MKIETICPCCGEDICINIDLLQQDQELSEDEKKKILDRLGIEFG